MSARAKWIIALALAILAALWLATLSQLRPVTTSQLPEVHHAS
ncbi:MAG: hypothetical protein ACU0GG_14645 [Paracoccaceae bacterium]